MSGLVRPFAPAHAEACLEAIDLEKLWEQGKRLLLLDVDNTIVAWRQESFSPEVLAWIEKAKSLGFEICIISNTRRVERLARIRQTLGVETVRGRFKPSRAMYRLALIKFNRKPEEAVMIGDQMMTDILGANRAGIDAIWVQRMDGKEFVGTAVNRFVERLLTSAVYKALVMPEDRRDAALQPALVREITLVQQVLRFLIVGGFSFVIDAGLTFVLIRVIPIGGQPMGLALQDWLNTNVPGLFAHGWTPEHAVSFILGGAASLVAMFNSFFWNRLWTFEAKGRDRRSAQVVRFYVVSILGAMLNAVLFSAFNSWFTGTANRRLLLAKIAAAAIVAVYNFVGQRYFAFRPRRAA